MGLYDHGLPLDPPDGIKPRFWNTYREARIKNPNAVYFFDIERAKFPYTEPFILHRNDFKGHAHIWGPTQSGKSSMGVAPAFFNFADIAANLWHNPWLSSDPRRLPGLSITVIDGKGSRALLQFCRWCADLFGLSFRIFSNADIPTHSMNVFSQPWFQRLEPRKQAGILAAGAGVTGGQHSSQAFFDSQTMRVFTPLCEQGPRSFRFFKPYTSESGRAWLKSQGRPVFYSEHEWRESRGLGAFLDTVVTMDQLNVTRSQHREAFDHQLNLEDGFTRPCINYVMIQDTSGDSYLAPAITGLVIAALGAIATEKENAEEVYLPQLCILDDTTAAAGVVAGGLTKFAEFAIDFILCDHHPEAYPVQIRDLIWAASRTKLFLCPTTELERQMIMDSSGEQLEYLQSYNYTVDHLGGGSFGESNNPIFRPVHGRNDVLSVAASKYHAFIHMRSDSTAGTEPLEGRTTLVRMLHLLTQDKQTELTNRSLLQNDLGPGTFLPSELRRKSKKPGRSPAASGNGDADSIKEAFQQTTMFD